MLLFKQIKIENKTSILFDIVRQMLNIMFNCQKNQPVYTSVLGNIYMHDFCDRASLSCQIAAIISFMSAIFFFCFKCALKRLTSRTSVMYVGTRVYT